MTRKKKRATPSRPAGRQPKAARSARAGHWILQDAKARFSELVRRARSEGPQHVTVHGRDEVVVMSADEFHRLKGDRSGQLLVDLLRSSPLRDVPIEPASVRSPIRDVEL
ncbi:MAG: type II toxin-antitoxin system Phd/YefM family antitoxin [Longimicrobiales bacterium]